MAIIGAERAEKEIFEGRLQPFVRSKVFTNLFAHGMELVEETATYLDNGGRRAAKSLDREDALSYAGVSMRLTTRLMQIASWLLVLRAVRDGEMSEDEARDDKYRLGSPERADRQAAQLDGLPEPLIDLIEQTDTLYARINRLDRDLFVGAAPTAAADGDAQGRLQALQQVFRSE
jgi:regulator of CtrA degradation